MSINNCDSEIDSDGYELAGHGTISFPVAAYDDNISLNPICWHWHDEFEAVIITQGQGIICVDSNRIQVQSGEGIFINSGIIHSAETQDENFCVHAIVFHGDLIAGRELSIFHEKYITPLMRSSKFLYIKKNSECLENLLRAWKYFERENFGYEFLVREELSRFMIQMCQKMPRAVKISESEQRITDRVKIMLNFIHENFAQEITLMDIAGSASISDSEALRCFHKILGTTPIKYVKNFRLDKAKNLLRSSDMTVTEIAESCGFRDMSSFAKSFREKYLLTPSDSRKKSPHSEARGINFKSHSE